MLQRKCPRISQEMGLRSLGAFRHEKWGDWERLDMRNENIAAWQYMFENIPGIVKIKFWRNLKIQSVYFSSLPQTFSRGMHISHLPGFSSFPSCHNKGGSQESGIDLVQTERGSLP